MKKSITRDNTFTAEYTKHAQAIEIANYSLIYTCGTISRLRSSIVWQIDKFRNLGVFQAKVSRLVVFMICIAPNKQTNINPSMTRKPEK